MADEYISKQVFNDSIREAVRKYPNTFYNGLEVARQIALDMDVADVVPVVRCKDCKHGIRLVCDLAGNEGILCRHGNIYHRLDWFCADGQKRDGEA